MQSRRGFIDFVRLSESFLDESANSPELFKVVQKKDTKKLTQAINHYTSGLRKRNNISSVIKRGMRRPRI